MQLTSLRPTADLFCSLLRDALKVELQKGNMKAVKGFVKMSYSEQLVANASDNSDEKAAAAEAARRPANAAADVRKRLRACLLLMVRFRSVVSCAAVSVTELTGST